MRGAGWSRVTHPFATLFPAKAGLIVRLACVRHAASVHPEPGSNSPFDLGLPVSREREPTGFHKFENKSEFKEVSNKCTLWHVSICLPRRMSCMPSVRHSIRFSRCRRARARRSRLVAAQERTIPASRMPCQGKFSRDFSDPLRRRRCLPASRASRRALRAGPSRLGLVIIPAPAVLGRG